MKVHVPIKLRWSDIDAYGHVNNVEMLRLLEQARIEAFWKTIARPAIDQQNVSSPFDSDTLTFVLRQEAEYLKPIPYMRESLDIQLWLGRLSGASIDVCYEVYSPAGGKPQTLFARAITTIVLIDQSTKAPRRITAQEKKVWNTFCETPLVMRKSFRAQNL